MKYLIVIEYITLDENSFRFSLPPDDWFTDSSGHIMWYTEDLMNKHISYPIQARIRLGTYTWTYTNIWWTILIETTVNIIRTLGSWIRLYLIFILLRMNYFVLLEYFFFYLFILPQSAGNINCIIQTWPFLSNIYSPIKESEFDLDTWIFYLVNLKKMSSSFDSLMF